MMLLTTIKSKKFTGIKVITLCIYLLFLAGCVPTVNVIPEQYKMGDSSNGIVIVSMTQNNISTEFKAFLYKGSLKDSEYQGVLSSRLKRAFLPWHEKGDFPWYIGETPTGFIGRVVAMELPPGDYMFRKWELKFNDIHSLVPLKFPKAVMFTVKSNKIYYIGNIHADLIESNSVVPSIKDMYDRDVEVFKNKYPNLASKEILKQVTYTGLWLPLKNEESN